MSAVRRSIVAWLQGSLHRWLFFPFVIATLVVTLGAALLGSLLLAQISDRLPLDAARVAGIVWAFFILALSAAGVVLAITYRLVSQAVAPVTGMVDAARTVAVGDFQHPLPQDAIGELADLACALEQVAEHVQRQTATLAERAHHAAYLFEASAELSRTLNFDESLSTAAEAIYGLERVTYVVVLTGHGELGPYKCVAVRGLPPEAVGQVLGHEYGVPLWGVMARALVSRQPQVIDDVVAQNRPREGEFNWDVSAGSMLLFPICGATGPYALLIVGATEPGSFSAGQSGDVVFALLHTAANSIQKANLYREAMRAQEQLVTLQVISRLVASSSQIEKVLDVVMREAAEVMGDSQVWLYLDDAGARRLYSWPKISDSWGTVHQDAVDWVLQAGQPIFYNPEYPLARSPILVHTGPAMCVPLESADETLGALVVASRTAGRVFIEDDMIVLRTLANAAAAALLTRQAAEGAANRLVELAQAWGGDVDRRLWGHPGHTRRVAQNALVLAAAMGIPAELLHVIEVAGYLHDIAAQDCLEDGQVCLRAETVPHAAQAAEWLAQAGLDSRIVTLVRHHHLARPEVVVESGDLGVAASALALAHAVDIWALGTQTDPDAAVAEVRAHLAEDAGGNFTPTIIAKLEYLLTTNQIALV